MKGAGVSGRTTTEKQVDIDKTQGQEGGGNEKAYRRKLGGKGACIRCSCS